MPSTYGFHKLPTELLLENTFHLPPYDIYALRLISSDFHASLPPLLSLTRIKFNREYYSAAYLESWVAGGLQMFTRSTRRDLTPLRRRGWRLVMIYRFFKLCDAVKEGDVELATALERMLPKLF